MWWNVRRHNHTVNYNIYKQVVSNNIMVKKKMIIQNVGFTESMVALLIAGPITIGVFGIFYYLFGRKKYRGKYEE